MTNAAETVRPGASTTENADDAQDVADEMIARIYEPGRGHEARDLARAYLAKFGIDSLPRAGRVAVITLDGWPWW